MLRTKSLKRTCIKVDIRTYSASQHKRAVANNYQASPSSHPPLSLFYQIYFLTLFFICLYDVRI